MKEFNWKPIAEMSTQEILDEYNKLTEGSVKRFSTRAVAERRLQDTRTCAEIEARDKAAKKSGKTDGAKPKKEKATKSAKPKKEKAARKPGAKSEARNLRHSITVFLVGDAANTKAEHRSVAAAFTALKLPMSKHIPFRAMVKKEGTADFRHGDKVFRFTAHLKTPGAKD